MNSLRIDSEKNKSKESMESSSIQLPSASEDLSSKEINNKHAISGMHVVTTTDKESSEDEEDSEEEDEE